MLLMDQKLSQHRKKIDALDDELFVVLQKRFHEVARLAEWKKEKGKEFLDAQREAEILDHIRQKLPSSNLPHQQTLELWQKILDISHSIGA